MLERFDVVTGTVVCNYRECSIVNCDNGCRLKCRAALPVGVRGVFTITSYKITEKGKTYFAELDSAVYDAA